MAFLNLPPLWRRVAFFSQYTSRADSSTVNITTPSDPTPSTPYIQAGVTIPQLNNRHTSHPGTAVFQERPAPTRCRPPGNITQHRVAIWASDAWKSTEHAGACSFWYTTLTAQRIPQSRLWGRWRHSMGLLGTLGFLIFPASRAKGTCRRRMD
jgi:hypothetical protein